MFNTIEIELVGIIGSFCFALSGLPQMFKSIKEGHSKGIAHGTIWLWIIGELAMLVYAVFKYPGDFILLCNYLANLLIVGIIGVYKYKNWKYYFYYVLTTIFLTKRVLNDILSGGYIGGHAISSRSD